ncbi:MAG: hypothetical protein E7427_04875 [Ruminococcaceae bacterium]|nr:hypothetical protein [Oscillospiraceae bacterium]
MAGLWTNNWRGIKNLMLLGAVAPGLSTVVDANGTEITFYPNSDFGVVALPPLNNHAMGAPGIKGRTSQPGTQVLLGTGGAVSPAVGDYRLAAYPGSLAYLSMRNSGLTVSTAEGTASRSYTLTVQNQSSGAMTLTEWGLFLCPVYMRVDSALQYPTRITDHPVLVYHAALDTPLTLQSYEAATLTLTLELTLDDPV